MTVDHSRSARKWAFVFVVWICAFCGSDPARAQTILNGSFEINTAPHGNNQMNLTNDAFNDLVTHCHSYGNPSEANLDLITTSEWGGPAQDGNWYLGVQAGIDQLSFKLTAPLISGATYYLTYYDRVRMGHCATPVQIGISNAEDHFGMLVHTGTVPPTIGEWKPRLAVFTMPWNAEYITVRGYQFPCWVQIDAFCLSVEESCIDLPAFQMPNVFTPNGDGINDTFAPINLSGVVSGTLTILDRWGNTLHTSQDLASGWSGRHNGSLCSDGVYFWTVQYHTIFEEFEVESGSLMLLRD